MNMMTIVNNFIASNILGAVSYTHLMLPVVAMNYYELPLFAVFVNLIVIPALPVVFISGLLASAAGCFGAVSYTHLFDVRIPLNYIV